MNTSTVAFVSRQLRYERSWSSVASIAFSPFQNLKLTFGDENVLSLHPDQDVCLALKIERLPRSVAAEGTIELHEEVTAQTLFAHFEERMRVNSITWTILDMMRRISW